MTRFTGKVIAGLIGFLAFGPAGLLFGLVLGHAFDQGLWRALQLSGPEAVHIMREQFFETTFTLLGFVAKADGRVSEAEIAQTESLFTQLRLTAAQRRTAIERFKTGSASGFDPAPTVSTGISGGQAARKPPRSSLSAGLKTISAGPPTPNHVCLAIGTAGA